MKANAVRLLDTTGIRYELREYPVDPAALDANLAKYFTSKSKNEVFLMA